MAEPFSLISKISELVFGSLPKVALALIPDHRRRDIQARLADFNPLAAISANEDLVRALRLAWIEAALAIDTEVRPAFRLRNHADPATENARRFSVVLRRELRALRQQAFNRQLPPSGRPPIDQHLSEVLIDVPNYIRSRWGDAGTALTDSFSATLAATVRYPIADVPARYQHVAKQGLLFSEGPGSRSFGELVYAAFAEIIKTPQRYPQAGQAFAAAQAGMARELALSILSVAKGLEDRFDRLLTDLAAVPSESYTSLAGFGQLADSMARRIEVLTAATHGIAARQEDAIAIASRTEAMVSSIHGAKSVRHSHKSRVAVISAIAALSLGAVAWAWHRHAQPPQAPETLAEVSAQRMHLAREGDQTGRWVADVNVVLKAPGVLLGDVRLMVSARATALGPPVRRDLTPVLQTLSQRGSARVQVPLPWPATLFDVCLSVPNPSTGQRWQLRSFFGADNFPDAAQPAPPEIYLSRRGAVSAHPETDKPCP